jgi:hypothetical protein
MRSKIIMVILSILLLLSSTGYTQVTDGDLYTRLSSIDNKLGNVELKVDRNSDLIKLGFESNASYHIGIIGRVDGLYSRIDSIDDKIALVDKNLESVIRTQSTNLIDYTIATNKIDSNNKSNDVMLRGEVVTTPASINYIGYIIVGCLSGLLSGGLIILVERISRPKHNVEHN